MSIQILEEEGFTKFIVFTPEEHPSQGPLPELKYKLIGLWKLNKSIVRAFFEAEEIPIENNESAFYRWEPVISPARSKHHYFYVPGAAGLSLKQNHLQKLVRSGDEAPTYLEDICGNFSPLSLQDLIESQS
jgi:hypothetical protein